MSVFELSDLVQELSVDQVEATIYRCLQTVGVSATNWKRDSALRVSITGFSVLFSYASSVTAALARGGYLELASGNWLTLLARYTYATERIGETFAQTTINFSNSAATAYNVAANGMIVGGTGVEYRVGEAFTIPKKFGSANGTVSVTALASVVGSAGNAPSGAITRLITPLPGVTCKNPLPITSGLDIESDAALRVRAQAAGQALSPDGARRAYRYVCTSTRRADGTSVGVARFKSIADGLGGVDCYVSSAAGPLVPSDLALLQASVEQECEPMAITARVANARAVPLSFGYEASVYATINLSDVQIQQLIAASIAQRLARLPIGGDEPGVLTASSILGAVYDAAPQIYRAAVTGLTDLALESDQVVVPGTITASITITPSAGTNI